MKLTPLYNTHLSLSAKMFTSAAGYEMPAYYTSIEEEHRAVRGRVGMIDLSLMGRIDIKGPQSLDLVQNLAVNDASKLADRQVMYTTFCNEEGNIVDDVTVWRIDENHFRVVTSSVMRYKTLAWILQHLDRGTNASVTDISSSLGMIAVQGPQSRRTLERVADVDLSQLKFFHFLNAKLGGVQATIARLGFSGELGYECYFSTEDTVQAWRNIQEAGKEEGITPYGLDALDSLRFEKGFIFFGYEVTEKNNPYEVGLEKWIKLDKPEFLGKQALTQLNSTGPKRKLVGLEFSDDEITAVAQPVDVNAQNIGETVAGFRGLTVRKNFAWAFVKADGANLGTKVTVETDGKSRPAQIVDIRYYDQAGERMRL